MFVVSSGPSEGDGDIVGGEGRGWDAGQGGTEVDRRCRLAGSEGAYLCVEEFRRVCP